MKCDYDHVMDELSVFVLANSFELANLGTYFISQLDKDVRSSDTIRLDIFHQHELTDRVMVARQMFDTIIREHPMAQLTGDVQGLCVLISMLLNRLYQDVGNVDIDSLTRCGQIE